MRLHPSEQLDRDLQYRNMVNALKGAAPGVAARKSSLKAGQMLSVANSYNFVAGYKKGNRVAFSGEQFPIEILHALGVVSVNLESMSAIFARSDSLKEFLQLGEEKSLSRDVCSVVRAEFGLGLGNCYPVPDFMITSTHPCDGFTKIVFNLAKMYGSKVLAMDVPSVVNDEVISYAKAQLERITREIEDTLGVKMSEEALSRVVADSNEAREYYYKTFELCRDATLPDVAHELMMVAMVGLWGRREIANVCKTLYAEALELHRRCASAGKKKRVIWYGQMSFHSDEVVAHLERETEIIYLGSLLNYGELTDPADPFRSFAKRYVQYSWHPETMRGVLETSVDRFGVNGIVLQNAWGCRNLVGLNSVLREVARKKNMKVLSLDNDYLDKDKVAFGHVKNRMDAFLEIL